MRAFFSISSSIFCSKIFMSMIYILALNEKKNYFRLFFYVSKENINNTKVGKVFKLSRILS